MYTCRECEAEINSGTEICPQCGADLTIAPADDGSAKPPPNRQRIIIRWVVLLAILFGSLWSFLWFVVSPRTGQPTLQAETQALDSLTQIQSALSSYSAAMSGAYPSTLDPLGPPVRVAAQRAQSLGYQLQYVPGPHVVRFSITASTFLHDENNCTVLETAAPLRPAHSPAPLVPDKRPIRMRQQVPCRLVRIFRVAR